MTAVDLIDECYKVDELGEDMVNINTSDEVKKQCAKRMAKNDKDLGLWPLSRHLHSCRNGAPLIRHDHHRFRGVQACHCRGLLNGCAGIGLRASAHILD